MSQTTAPARLIRARSARRPVLEGQELVLVGVIAALWLVLSLMTDTFFTGANIRTILYAIAPVAVLKTFSSLKDWGIRLSKKVGYNKAKIAVARKLAVIMFGIWRDGTHFQFKADTVAAHREMMQAARH